MARSTPIWPTFWVSTRPSASAYTGACWADPRNHGVEMQSFQPPRRILMGPGPSDVSPRVLSALARPTIGHLDPEFQNLMEEIKAALQRLFNAPDHACVPLPAPGTAGMEAAMMNLLEPGDRCVVAVNGAFGGRMADMADRAGATVVTVDHEWGQPVDPVRVAAALAEAPTKVLAFV